MTDDITSENAATQTVIPATQEDSVESRTLMNIENRWKTKKESSRHETPKAVKGEGDVIAIKARPPEKPNSDNEDSASEYEDSLHEDQRSDVSNWQF